MPRPPGSPLAYWARRNADNFVPSDPRVRPWRRPRASPAGPRRTWKPSRNHLFRGQPRGGRVTARNGPPPGRRRHGDGRADGDADGAGEDAGGAEGDGWRPAGADVPAAFRAAFRAVFILATSAA